jgi:hypothetical protein
MRNVGRQNRMASAVFEDKLRRPRYQEIAAGTLGENAETGGRRVEECPFAWTKIILPIRKGNNRISTQHTR